VAARPPSGAFLRLLAEMPFPVTTPSCEKAMLENPQIFQHSKSTPLPGGAIYVTFQITWTISNGKKK